ncbi:mitotic deacetylase-associated SANT domain protein [Hippocampus zosterae]|uniref:mitotic deacetylase-associated SANT domain protein n=1 Tax=Hippocampus zosterae TaxID=109293 RepID=UPI00223E58F3|nr:mitotic deacetylase-associated SANT domain protein [Hippocampus zosterae]XP_051941484.1 mitotic deacetylase-associated SANT domain protein [Hippocampus zosterae]
MLTMSVPAQQKPGAAKRTGKRITFFSDPTMKETAQHGEASYYIQGGGGGGGGGGEPGKSEAASGAAASNPEGHRVYLNSVIFSPDKGDQNRGHYQQTLPMKWPHQESGQPQPRATTWTPVANWGQNFVNYLSESRNQTDFVKQETGDEVGDKQAPAYDPAADLYRDAVKARGLDWDQQQQQQSQTFQETLKPGALNPQPNSASHPVGSSVLQPFQLAFGQPRQHLPPYYQSFQGNARLPNPPNYSVQAKLPQQAPQVQRQNLIQQQLEQQQQMILQQQQHQQLQMQHQQLQQQSQHVLDYYPPNVHSHPQFVHSQEPSLAAAPPQIQEPLIQDVTPAPQSFDPPSLPSVPPEPSSETQNLRRSRRLSKEGGAPSDDNPFPGDPAMRGPQNGTRGGGDADVLAAPTGVIQSTPRRKRRVSQEVNLETLAQKASEMETLPSQDVEEPHRSWGPSQPGGPGMKRPRDDGLLPLVIPVSVPVRRLELSSCGDRAGAAPACGWPPLLPPPPPPRPSDPPEIAGAERKPSVIVTRRRSLRNSLNEGSEQNGEDSRADDDVVKKLKRHPRPEPLFIPPPKPGAFTAPAAVYSAVTPYQSHLRSPVRLADNPLAVPPYTPPPILSPVREGSGLYFATFLSAAPSATPKSASRNLLCSSSCDMTPPILSAVSEPTAVSIEPRINMGSRYQAEVPDLRPRSLAELDAHGAELVWAPLTQLEDKPDYHKRVKDLMHLACSSALRGGGSNQELAHHCLHRSNGDIMAALSLLMLSDPVFPTSHSLSDYHYSGSDKWSAAERRQFNKGMAAYKKDFFMVQKQVSTKTVAQCVEFYYSYKKHVKVGRNGTLIYGEAASPSGGTTEEEDTNPNKAAHRLQQQQQQQEEEDNRKWEGSADRKQEVGPAHTLPSAETTATVLIMRSQEDVVARDGPPPPPLPPHVVAPPHRTGPSTGNKGAGGPEGEFPCKKCGRVFYKVKSRSAHMKSHAEQEKKAAALRQKEAEDRARAAQAQARAAAFMAARQPIGTRQAGGDSEDDEDDTSDSEDDDDDWQ